MKQGILITVVGRAVSDPELRFSGNGMAIGKVRVVATERKKDQASGKWEDGDSTFLDVTVFGADAEALNEGIRKGDNLVVTGRFKAREYDRRDGGKGMALEVVADGFGLMPKAGGTVSKQTPADDPWLTPAPAPEPAPF